MLNLIGSQFKNMKEIEQIKYSNHPLTNAEILKIKDDRQAIEKELQRQKNGKK